MSELAYRPNLLTGVPKIPENADGADVDPSHCAVIPYDK